MSRKLILGIAVLALMCVMLGAPLHEAMERYHTPFPVDGDFAAMLLAMLVGTCVTTTAVAVPLFALLLALVFLIGYVIEGRDPDRGRSLEYQKLLFSPPEVLLSLRI